MRLYLAGSENSLCGNYLCEIENSKYCLFSFYSLLDKNNEKLDTYFKKHNKTLLLDSGAFTFRTMQAKGKKLPCNIDEYTEKYIKFINKYNIEHFFEMDIDMCKEDLPKVLQLRQRIEQGTGKKCIPVFHKCRGLNEWINMCNNYNYIAIGGIAAAGSKLPPEYKKLIDYANSKKVKVHGLGFTRKGFENIGFYSVDSTSWNEGKFGGIWFMDYKLGNCRKYNKDRTKRLITTEQKNVFGHNWNEWCKYQRYVMNKGFWKEEL